MSCRSLEERRAIDRERSRLRRQNESSENRKRRLEKVREQARLRRQNERLERGFEPTRLSQKEYMLPQKESIELYKRRLEKQRLRQIELRQNESKERRYNRLQDDKVRHQKKRRADAEQEKADAELLRISIAVASRKRVIQIQIFQNVIVAIGVHGARCWSNEYYYLEGGGNKYPNGHYSVLTPKPWIKFIHTDFRYMEQIMERVNDFAQNRKFSKDRYTQIPPSYFWDNKNYNDNRNRSCYWAVGPTSLFKAGNFKT